MVVMQPGRLKDEYLALLQKVRAAIAQLDLARDEREAEELRQESQKPEFWNDPPAAAAKQQKLSGLEKRIDFWRGLERELADGAELSEMADEGEAGELQTSLERLSAEFAKGEIELKLSGPHDRSDAILEVMAGAGGTDAQDWAQMLERMYLRHAERQGYSASVLSRSEGEEAGIKSVTIEMKGDYAYGRLKGEKGVHRLVRISPFNSAGLRQTSFAKVEVMPQVEQEELEIDPKDLRIDVYRAGGHGGQSVNTTDSAVRITHLPTGLVVAIQNERSQLQNREKAMAVLKSRLAVLMEEQHQAELSKLRGPNQSAEWGSQIRSYVLHPYTKIKDHRTGEETGNVQAVLDGELNAFIEAYLHGQIGSGADEE